MATHLLSRRLQVAIETEATAGTAETLVAADVAFRAGSATISMQIENEVQDLMQADLSELPDLIGNRPVTITFDTLIQGSGSAGTAPGLREIFIHGGFLETVTASTSVAYTPETPTTTNPCTIGIWRGPTTGGNGRLWRAKGCRLQSASIEVTPGKPMKLSCVFVGAMHDAADAAAFSSVTYDSTVPQTARNLGLTIGSWSPFFSALTININNQTAAIVNPGGTGEDSGISHYEITARRIEGSITFMDVLASTKDWLADLLSGTEAALTFTLGATAGNKFKVDAPKFQLLLPSETDIDGILGQSLDWKANRNSGDDEAVFTFL